MNQLLAFYLLTSAVQILPGILVAVSLLYGLPHLHNVINGQRRVNDRTETDRNRNRPRNIDLIQLERALQLFDSDIVGDMARFSLASSIIQVTTVITTCLAVYYDIPLPFVGNINDSETKVTNANLMYFLLTTSALQLIPMILLFLTFACDIQIPFLPESEDRESHSNVRPGFQRSQVDASYRLIRFKSSRHTIIFARLSKAHFGGVHKVVFVRRNEVGAITHCFLHNEATRSLEMIPAPLTISLLEEIFNFDNN